MRGKKVTISYSHENEDVLEKISAVLRNLGCEVFYGLQFSTLSLHSTSLRHACKTSDATIYLISPDFAVSDACLNEVVLGQRTGTLLLPIMVKYTQHEDLDFLIVDAIKYYEQGLSETIRYLIQRLCEED